MSGSGVDILEVGRGKVGQKYVLGANVPLNNAAWTGPWDCAEFASWCAYQAYGLVFGAGRPARIGDAEPYSGHWHAEAGKYGTVIGWREALKIPGAVLIRKPATGLIGHVALSLGDGDRTLEARSAKQGVGIFPGAALRAWTLGCLLPGVEYGDDATPAPTPAAAGGPQAAFPKGYLWLKTPSFRGADIVALQKALKAKGISPGPIDGDFGSMVRSAVISWQVKSRLEVDGVVGRNTAESLGLTFPIVPTAADVADWAKLAKPAAPVTVTTPAPTPTPAQPGGVDTVVSVTPKGGAFEARTASGVTFIVGRATTYTDDMRRTGLYQGGAEIADSLRFGVFSAADFQSEFGPWAWLISPTLQAEGDARFATLNSYDRAAFTFGAPQFAAHTPRDNFVSYFRKLLALPEAKQHFPDLALKANGAGRTTIHLISGASAKDLEEEVLVTRPNGKTETQILHLMRYLNPSPTAVDKAELLAAARLMNWLRVDPRARALQIELFVEQSKARLARAKTKLPRFTGKDWRAALWINDILHQGRGTFAQMDAALSSADPVGGLAKIGKANYAGRVRTVEAGIAKLQAEGRLNGFEV